MNKTKYFLFALILLTSSIESCSVPGMIQKKFTFCYDGRPTGLESKISTDGFYEMTYIWWNELGYGKTYNPRWDTTHLDILFFRDGICAYDFGWYYQTGKQYLDSLANTPGNREINSMYKGVYRVFGDTIKIQVVNNPHWLSPTWMGYEIWYKIVDKNTLKEIGEKQLHNNNGFYSVEETETTEHKNNHLAHFISVDSLPSSDIWLKNKKWFLCQNR